MIRHEWNELQVGHHVLVHDDDDPTKGLTPGRVTKIEPGAGSNEITVRISSGRGPAREIRPRRLAVHLDDGESAERCWRCEAHAASHQTL